MLQTNLSGGLFFIEGALLGFMGSLIPVIALLYGYWKLTQLTSLEMSLLLIKLLPFQQIALTLSGLLLAIGLGIGVWGSLLSVRKHLKV